MILKLSNTGKVKFTSHVNAPTAHEGDLALENSGASDAGEELHFYVNSTWITCTDTDNW